MSEDNLISVLAALDLPNEQSEIFAHLYKNGSRSALEISRKLEIPRTSVYRNLDELQQMGLVVESQGRNGAIFSARGKEAFLQMIAQRDADLAAQRSQLPKLFSALSQIEPAAEAELEVNYYRGESGIEQVLWNQLAAKKEIKWLVTRQMEAYGVSKAFAEKVRREVVVRNLKIKEITNEGHISGFTQERGYINNHWQLRYLDPQVMKIDFEMIILPESITYFRGGLAEPMAVEIMASQLANFQSNIFDLLWVQSQEMLLIKPTGESKLVSRDLIE